MAPSAAAGSPPWESARRQAAGAAPAGAPSLAALMRADWRRRGWSLRQRHRPRVATVGASRLATAAGRSTLAEPPWRRQARAVWSADAHAWVRSRRRSCALHHRYSPRPRGSPSAAGSPRHASKRVAGARPWRCARPLSALRLWLRRPSPRQRPRPIHLGRRLVAPGAADAHRAYRWRIGRRACRGGQRSWSAHPRSSSASRSSSSKITLA